MKTLTGSAGSLSAGSCRSMPVVKEAAKVSPAAAEESTTKATTMTSGNGVGPTSVARNLHRFYKRLKRSLRFNACIGAVPKHTVGGGGGLPSSSQRLRSAAAAARPHIPSAHSATSSSQHSTLNACADEAAAGPSSLSLSSAQHQQQLERDLDGDSITSCGSEISTGALQNIRDQMATSLRRMRDLEEQARLVPVLQQQLARLREEKRQLQRAAASATTSSGTITSAAETVPPPQPSISLDRLGVSGSTSTNNIPPFHRPAQPSRKGPAPPPPTSTSPIATVNVAADTATPSTAAAATASIKRDIGIQTTVAPPPPTQSATAAPTPFAPPAPTTRTCGTSTAPPPAHRTCGTSTDTRVYSAAELQAAIDHTLHAQQQIDLRRQLQHRKSVGIQHNGNATAPAKCSAHTQTPPPPRPPAAVRTRNAATSCRPAQRTVACGAAEQPPPVAALRAASPLALMSRSMDSTAAAAALMESEAAATASSISLRSLMAMGLRDVSAERSATAAAAEEQKPVAVERKSVAVQCGRVTMQARAIQATVEKQPLVTVGTQVKPITTRTQSTDTVQLHTVCDRASGPSEHTDPTSPPPPSLTDRASSPIQHPATDDDEPSAVTAIVEPQPPQPPQHVRLTCTCDACLSAIRQLAQKLLPERVSPAPPVPTATLLSPASAAAAAVAEHTRIPRPTTLSMSPRPERRFVRQTTYTVPTTPTGGNGNGGADEEQQRLACPAEAILRRLSDASKETIYGHHHTSPHHPHGHQHHPHHSHSLHSPHKVHPISHAPTVASPLAGRRHMAPTEAAAATAVVAELPFDGAATEPTEGAATNTDITATTTSTTATSTEESEAVTAGAASSTPCREKENRLPMPSGPPVRPEDACLAAEAKPHVKATPSRETAAALKVINDALQQLHRSGTGATAATAAAATFAHSTRNAQRVVQKEWFRVSSTEQADPLDVEDYLDTFEECSNALLKYMVNLADTNGNTAMHYAVSHGNFDVVSILLDSKFCNVNQPNHAGYTCVMLVSLAQLQQAAHQTVVRRLLQLSDVNVRAQKHGQTSLMLAVSHGNADMARMLLEAGADINIQDEDGSTALMCAAEHGRGDIVRLLLAQPDCDSTVQDMDGSTALKISLEAGHHDIGVLLYAHEHITRTARTSPYTSLRRKRVSGGAKHAAVASSPPMSASLHGTLTAGGSGGRSQATGSGSMSMPSSPMPSAKFHHHHHHK